MSSSMPPITPMPMQGERRRRQRWRDGSNVSYVPLWTPLPEGQWIDGKIDVPDRLAFSEQHTNARHELDNLLRQNIERWVAWRAQKGWFITTNPMITGPVDPPVSGSTRQKQHEARAVEVIGKGRSVSTKDVLAEPEDFRWFMVRARFKRLDPIYISLEDVLEMRRLAAAYEIDLDQDFLPENILPKPVSVIDVDGGLDPMVVAEERRQAHGLKREDYLIGKLGDPL